MALRFGLATVVCLTLLLAASAQPVPVTAAHGKVQKVDKDTLTFQPRDESGKFGKAVTLKLTGTSRFTTLAPQKRDKTMVMAQKETDAKDVAAGQLIAVIYASPTGQDNVLLSAVIHNADK
jgi:hypothetical protein